MKISDYLNEKQKKQLDVMKNEEKVNWKEIMGMNRDTYKRGKGGAMRRV